MAIAVAALGISAGGGCRRLDPNDLVTLEVRFERGPDNQTGAPFDLHVWFAGFDEKTITVSGWKQLQQAHSFTFMSSEFPDNVEVTVIAKIGECYRGSPLDKRGMSYPVTLGPVPPPVDGDCMSPDAGAPEHPPSPDAEAGTDDHDDGGAHSADCDATSSEPPPQPPPVTCDNYCAAVVPNCQVTDTDCRNTCVGLGWERTPMAAGDQNTLACHTRWAAMGGPGGATGACESARWNGGYFCGTPCDAFCDAGQVNCGEFDLFKDSASCRDQCNSLAVDLTCRVNALIDAGLHPENKQAACMTATGVGGACP